MAYRQFTDAVGRSWQVWEVRTGDGWLTFQTNGEKRRLSPTPEGWTDSPDNDLLMLLEQATQVRAPRRLIE